MHFTNYDIKIFSAFCLVAKESNNPNEVTISKIALKLGVTRQAIYKSYYRNINEIINALHLYIEKDIYGCFEHELKQKGSSCNYIQFIANDILPKLYQKREYLNILYGTSIDTSWHSFLVKKYTHLLNQKLLKNENKLSTEYTEFIVSQALAVIGVWMRCEEPEHPIYFKKRFLFLMNNSISEILYKKF